MSGQMIDDTNKPRAVVLSTRYLGMWALFTVSMVAIAAFALGYLTGDGYWHHLAPKHEATAAADVAKPTTVPTKTPGPLAWMKPEKDTKPLRATFAIPAHRTPAEHLDVLCTQIEKVANTYPKYSGIPGATSSNCTSAKAALSRGDNARSNCTSAIEGALNIAYDSRLNIITNGDMAYACGDNHTLT